MPRPIFDEQKHKYTLGGYTLPSVTAVLAGLILVNTGVGEKFPFYVDRLTGATIDAPVIRAAGDHGSAVHKCMEYTLKGVEFDYPQEIHNSVENLALWKSEVKPDIIAIEEILASAEYHYAGTLDIFCQIGKELWLVDVKTAAASKFVGPQLAAYEQLWREETGERKKINRAELYLPKKGGRYQWRPQTSKGDWAYFKNRLWCYQFEKTL